MCLPVGRIAYLAATVIVGIGIAVAAITYVSPSMQIGKTSAPGKASHAAPVESPPIPIVGRISGAVDCKSNDSDERIVRGAAVPLGRKYALVSGLLEITYVTGAKVILQGPTTYEVESTNGGYLAIGSLTARLEKKAASKPNLQSATHPSVVQHPHAHPQASPILARNSAYRSIGKAILSHTYFAAPSKSRQRKNGRRLPSQFA